MGSTTGIAVYAAWSNLPSRYVRVLVYMALRSLDNESGDQAPRRYFAGTTPLVYAMGLANPALFQIPTDGQKRTVTNALHEMKKLGALRHVKKACNGHNAEWEIVLTCPAQPGAPVDNACADHRSGAPPAVTLRGTTRSDPMGHHPQ